MVFVLDKYKKPLMPCTEKRARQLLQRKRAVIHKFKPFTIRLKDRSLKEIHIQPLRLKLDPGSKISGIAVLRELNPENSVAIYLAELHHKLGIKDKLDARRAQRRSRRNRKTRYRKPRFKNRRRKERWLPPSLEARVNQSMNTLQKLCNNLPITSISTEHVKFDTYKIQNPEVKGIEYQQGELFGYEVREYLLEKWGRKCAYCGTTGVKLEIEHVVPKNPTHGSKGTDRISNLTIACKSCNKTKGNKQPQKWLTELQKSNSSTDKRRATNLPKVLVKLKQSLKDAAMLNATRWELYGRLKETGLPVECGTGAMTKMQRITHKLPKEHYFDACCVGASTPKNIAINQKHVQIWTALGRGIRKMCNPDAYGFPKSYRTRKKIHYGFQTGDIVVANIPKGKYKGCWIGRVVVRASGYFDIKDSTGKRLCQGISHRHLRVLQRSDGWQYEKKFIAG